MKLPILTNVTNILLISQYLMPFFLPLLEKPHFLDKTVLWGKKIAKSQLVHFHSLNLKSAAEKSRFQMHLYIYQNRKEISFEAYS